MEVVALKKKKKIVYEEKKYEKNIKRLAKLFFNMHIEKYILKIVKKC